MSDDNYFAARNAADWSGGAFVYVPRGATLKAPVLITAVQAAAQTAMAENYTGLPLVPVTS